jgi:hypothetical protein
MTVGLVSVVLIVGQVASFQPPKAFILGHRGKIIFNRCPNGDISKRE